MNLQRINEIRAGMGLQPLPQRNTLDQKRRQAANRAKRAQECRDLKAARSGSGKKGR